MPSDPTKAIGRYPVWQASLEDLLRRWQNDTPSGYTAPDEEPGRAVRRVQNRADAVARFLKIQKPPLMATTRRWETEWKPEPAWDRLATAIKPLGWTAVLTTDDRPATTMTISASSSHSDAAYISRSAAHQLAGDFRNRGLLLPFTWKEGAALLLAREVFSIGTDQVGNAPAREWVDDLAREAFSRDVLGWPFYPLAAHFAPAPAR